MRELQELAHAYARKYDHDMLMLATHASWVLMPNAKRGKTIKPRDLWPDQEGPSRTARLKAMPSLKEVFALKRGGNGTGN